MYGMMKARLEEYRARSKEMDLFVADDIVGLIRAVTLRTIALEKYARDGGHREAVIRAVGNNVDGMALPPDVLKAIDKDIEAEDKAERDRAKALRDAGWSSSNNRGRGRRNRNRFRGGGGYDDGDKSAGSDSYADVVANNHNKRGGRYVPSNKPRGAHYTAPASSAATAPAIGAGRGASL